MSKVIIRKKMDCFPVTVFFRAGPQDTGQEEIASQCDELYTEHIYFGNETALSADTH